MSISTLLAQCSEFEPEYLPSRNSDHLPMALSAMQALGAPMNAMQSFFDDYSKKLQPIDKKGIYYQKQQQLTKQIEEQGIQPVVSSWIPELLPGLATRAFHPLIRLGFGISFDQPSEVASALAYWQVAQFSPPLQPAERGPLRLVLERDGDPGLESGSFTKNLLRLDQQHRYPAPVEDSLLGCAAASLDVYLGTRNFFALHLVTATQAASVCEPYVDDSVLMSSLTAALRAAYQIVGAPDFQVPMAVPDRLDPEHAIKYCYACLMEHRRTGDDRYRAEIAGFKSAGLVPDWVNA